MTGTVLCGLCTLSYKNYVMIYEGKMHFADKETVPYFTTVMLLEIYGVPPYYIRSSRLEVKGE